MNFESAESNSKNVFLNSKIEFEKRFPEIIFKKYFYEQFKRNLHSLIRNQRKHIHFHSPSLKKFESHHYPPLNSGHSPTTATPSFQ